MRRKKALIGQYVDYKRRWKADESDARRIDPLAEHTFHVFHGEHPDSFIQFVAKKLFKTTKRA